jgi:electron transfer flavoprotein alpha subunit
MAQVLVLAEHDGSDVKKVTFELLTLARRLGEPVLAWAGPGAAQAQPRLAEFGAVTVYSSEQPELTEYAVAPVTDFLEQLSGDISPTAVLVASTAESKEVAGRLAVRTGSGVLTDAVGVGDDLTAEQLNFGGSVIVHSKVKTGTPIITVRANSIAPEPSPAAAEISPVTVAFRESSLAAKITERVAAARGGART